MNKERQTFTGYAIKFNEIDANGTSISKDAININHFEKMKLSGEILDYSIYDNGVKITKKFITQMEDINKKHELPKQYTSVDVDVPEINERVKCFMSNGTETIGYRYENPHRSGWVTMYGGGLFANQAWSGIQVLGWKER